ncbi:MAG: thermonuclease family protein, partial [Carnobacterium sp.]
MKNSKKIMSGIGALVVLLIGTFFVADNQQITEPAKDTQRIAIELERVVDGDTIIMKENGERKRMRLLLIDTPESNTNKTGKTQPFGKEAKEFLTDYLKGKELSIVYDENHEKV